MRISTLLLFTAGMSAFFSPAFAEYAVAHYNPRGHDEYSLSAGGFKDTYKEPIFDLNTTANYGQASAGWTHYFSGSPVKQGFTSLEGRGSYSSGSHYKSTSGSVSGAKQYEFDVRFLTGFKFLNGNFESISPYTGLAVRYFRDELKGSVTDLNKYGYDRRITQLYVPLGVKYNYTTDEGISFTPTVEGDLLLTGDVESRLGNLDGYPYVHNTQKPGSGYGLRTSFMVGFRSDENITIEAGPFIRYWHVNDSKGAKCVPSSTPGYEYCYLEPKNSRTQYGAEVRLLW